MDATPEKFPYLPERIAGLAELAYNLWWSWHPEARMLFKRLNRPAWKESYYNPVKLLKVLPREALEQAAGDPDYVRHYDAVLARFREEMAEKNGWFAAEITEPNYLPIAYFSLEYGLHRSLPFYAGGLGFLAGDHLKEASDLKVPLVAVGFMYPEGYVRQRLDASGWQESVDEVLDRDGAPITRVLDGQGQQLLVRVPLMEPPIYVAVWRAMVGRVPLYLMDTEVPANDPGYRRIIDHLYISDLETRLRQEVVLGLGGPEVLQTLGIRHAVLHLNEGHAAFALLERLRERMAEGLPFAEAAEKVRATSIFTTHTPVPAGHDVFPFSLMDQYFGRYYSQLGLSREAFLALGASPGDPGAGFNMTAFALRFSAHHNGVSRRHGEVSRQMWQCLWPDRPEAQVPIEYITNGVHVPTWIEPRRLQLLQRYLGPDWLAAHDEPAVWELLDDIPDQEMWYSHVRSKIKLLNFIRERARRRWAEGQDSLATVVVGGTLLDPLALTIGFARRMVTYKRADLIFHDLERLKKLLNDPWRPVQIIFAGKAHPADDPAKQVLQRLFNHARDPALGGRVAVVEDYGEQLAQYLVHGVDVWLNNPQVPLEACGTSGMKASLNGVPHLSILDGWWLEGFTGDNGWAIKGGEKAPDRDAADAAALYEILEQQVIPLYYRVEEDGFPRGWVKLMKRAMASTAAPFSARRMVKEYSRKFYQEALRASAD